MLTVAGIDIQGAMQPPLDPDDFVGTDTEKVAQALHAAHLTGRPIIVKREYELQRDVWPEHAQCERQPFPWMTGIRCELKAGHVSPHVATIGPAHVHVWTEPE